MFYFPDITQFTNKVLRTLPNVNEFKSVSISCLGQPTCRPSQDCDIEWKRGTGTTYTILETKRIAVDTEGESLDKQWVVMETSSLNVFLLLQNDWLLLIAKFETLSKIKSI